MFERTNLNLKKITSGSKIKIQKNKLPPNFFKPLSIITEPKEQQNQSHQEIHTPSFGLHTEPVYQSLDVSKNSADKKQEFYSWFSKSGTKPLSHRAHTVQLQTDPSEGMGRNLTERKRKMERVHSLKQDKQRSSPYKVLKKYQKLISSKNLVQEKSSMKRLSENQRQKSKAKSKSSKQHSNLQSQNTEYQQPLIFKSGAQLGQLQRSLKSHFKLNPTIKKNAMEVKYKQYKALQSISSNTVKRGVVLPTISSKHQ